MSVLCPRNAAASSLSRMHERESLCWCSSRAACRSPLGRRHMAALVSSVAVHVAAVVLRRAALHFERIASANCGFCLFVERSERRRRRHRSPLCTHAAAAVCSQPSPLLLLPPPPPPPPSPPQQRSHSMLLTVAAAATRARARTLSRVTKTPISGAGNLLARCVKQRDQATANCRRRREARARAR